MRHDPVRPAHAAHYSASPRSYCTTVAHPIAIVVDCSLPKATWLTTPRSSTSRCRGSRGQDGGGSMSESGGRYVVLLLPHHAVCPRLAIPEAG